MGGRQVGSRRQRAGSGLRSRAEPQPGAHTAAEQRTPNQTVGPVLGESESEEKERRRQRDGEGERDRDRGRGGQRGSESTSHRKNEAQVPPSPEPGAAAWDRQEVRRAPSLTRCASTALYTQTLRNHHDPIL